MAIFCAGARADYADDARVDINGEKDEIVLDIKKESSGGKAVHAEWRGDKKEFNINATFPASKKWGEGYLSFVPKKSGKVTICLAGPNVKDAKGISKLVCIAFDDIKADGAKIENGSFEQTEKGAPVGWYRNEQEGGGIARLDEKEGADGRKSVVVWHNARYQQAFEVKEGKEVRISFKMRIVEEP